MKFAAGFLLFLWSAFLAPAAPTVLRGSVSVESVRLTSSESDPALTGAEETVRGSGLVVEFGNDLAVLQIPRRRPPFLTAFVIRGLHRQSDLGRKEHRVTHLSGLRKADRQPSAGTSTATVIAWLSGGLEKPRLATQGVIFIQDERPLVEPEFPFPVVTPPQAEQFLGHQSRTVRFRAMRDAKLTSLVVGAGSLDEAIRIVAQKILASVWTDPAVNVQEWTLPTP